MADGSTTTDETRGDDPGAGVTTAPAGLTGPDTGDDNAEDASEAPAGSPSQPPEQAPRQPTDAADPQRIAVRYVDEEVEPYLSAEDLERLDDVVAGGELPVGRPDLPARQPAAARAAAGRARQAAAARSLGHDPRPQLHLRAPEPRDHRSATSTSSTSSGPGHGGPAPWPAPGSTAPTARSTPTSRRTSAGMQRLFRQFSLPRRHPQPRRARDARLDPRGRRARLRASPRLRRRLRQPRPGRRVRRRRRRGRDGAARDQLALEQVPRPRAATARCCRSCTSTGTRSPTRRCWPASREDELIDLFAATAAAVLRDRRATARRCTSVRPRPSTTASTRSATSSGPAREDGRRRAPALADDHAAHRPRAGPARRRSTASRPRAPGAPTRCRSPTRDDAEHLHELEEWMRSYRPEELFDETASRSRRSAR